VIEWDGLEESDIGVWDVVVEASYVAPDGTVVRF
jgi:hypothetical protein